MKPKPIGILAECMADETPRRSARLHESRTLAQIKDMAHLLNLQTDHDSLRRALDVSLPARAAGPGRGADRGQGRPGRCDAHGAAAGGDGVPA
ncbi:MAG: hypothetical protein MZV65_41805 [Chromatiales bacterium]|nr:hypothetical protein [Chromatiales bacterium]